MAVTKIWAVRNNTGRVLDYANDPSKTNAGLENVLNYATNADKTEYEYYTEGLNCDPANALSDFNRVKNRYRKTDGVLAYHGYMSFAPGECTPDEAMAIGVEFARKQWGDDFQVVISEHLNTDCLHCHFVVNSVSFKDGHKMRDNEKNWNKFKHLADDICKEHGKSVVESPGEKKDQPTRRELSIKKALDEGIAATDSPEGLKKYLERRGWAVDFDHKHWTVTPKGWTKPYRIEKLKRKFPGSPGYSADEIKAQYENPRTKALPKPVKKSNRAYQDRTEIIRQVVNPYYLALILLLTLLRKRRFRYFIPIEKYKYEHVSLANAEVSRKADAEFNEFERLYGFIKQHNLKNTSDLADLKQKTVQEKTDAASALALVRARLGYEAGNKSLLADEEKYKKRLKEAEENLKIITKLEKKAETGGVSQEKTEEREDL